MRREKEERRETALHMLSLTEKRREIMYVELQGRKIVSLSRGGKKKGGGQSRAESQKLRVVFFGYLGEKKGRRLSFQFQRKKKGGEKKEERK